MPELPEVETIRRSLDPVVVGRTIERVELRTPRLRHALDESLSVALAGRRIASTSRRGKYLLFGLDDGLAWFFHMGMSGRLRFVDDPVPGLHDHVVAYFRGGGAIVFHDPRRFGCAIVDDPEKSKLIAAMGPEPLDEAAFDDDYMMSQRRRTARTVKDVLMDQRVVAGLGNIYVNEILFRAGVRPRRRMTRTTADECRKIVDATRVVIRDAIEHGGSTISDFLDGIGRRGGYQGHHLVYDREGKACLVCGTPIKAVIVGQRSSFYCPSCQT